MNTEDKKIRELLKNLQVEKTPEGFTSNVMNSITEFEESSKTVIQMNTIIPALLVFTSILVSIGVFYFFNNSLFENIFSPFAFLSDIFNNQFAWFNSYLMQLVSILKQNTFALGLGLILIILLSFDRVIFRRRLRINMLTII